MTPPTAPQGLFIVVEGPNDAGKSTLIIEIEAYFKALKREVRVVREPGGSPLGELLRPVLKHKEVPIGAFAGALLFNAGRHQNVRDIIEPGKDAGTILLFDRYTDSTRVYQLAMGTDLTLEEKGQIVQILDLMPVPDLTIYLQPTQELLDARKAAEAYGRTITEVDRFEGHNRELECYQRVAQEHARKHPTKCLIVPLGIGDNNKPVLPRIQKSLETLLATAGRETRLLTIRYRNWRGQKSIREIEPIETVWASSPYHAGARWILKARDPQDGNAIKDFDLEAIDFLSAQHD